MRLFAQDQGGREMRIAGIVNYFEDSHRVARRRDSYASGVLVRFRRIV